MNGDMTVPDCAARLSTTAATLPATASDPVTASESLPAGRAPVGRTSREKSKITPRDKFRRFK
ncbi:hypothetical protein HKX48_001050, partial [Thoreauomyces humboldtii]